MKKIKLVSDSDVALVKASSLFDAEWYQERYQDVKTIGLDPVEHFLWLGHRLGRSPSPAFSVPQYLRSNRDVKAAGVNPLLHYLKSGMNENRRIYPVQEQGTSADRQECRRILTPRNREWAWGAHEKTIHRLAALPSPFAADKVSIIMPTHNRAGMIEAAIRSALAQTHANFELIIVDDGSTDKTAELVKAFTDPRIIYTSNRHSKGVSGARNTGLDIAAGEWIFFLDSDNVWKDRLIEFLLKHAAATQSSAGYCAANVHDDAQQTKCILYADFDYETCLRSNFIDLNCFFMRWVGSFRDFRFDENLRRLVDWDLILRVAARTRVTGLPYVGVDYYDGTNERITNKEHVDRGAVIALQNQVRSKSRPLTVESERIRDASSYRIAALLHVFHPERVPEIIKYLSNIRVDFDLFVSTSLDGEHEALQLIRQAFPNVRIFFYPNVGADIAPFFGLMSTFKTYELVLKIHTKRDVEPWGDTWRKGLLEPLLGSAELVDEIIERFRADEKLAMACSADFYKHGGRNTIPPSMEQLELLAQKVGLSRYLDRDWAFVAGTMFWIRPQLLLKAARMMCDADGYSSTFVRDGAVEHGLERLLGLALWEDEANRVAIVSMDRSVREVQLGEGFSAEGVSQTMKRLYAQ
ncbi:glycosyltransferase [Brevundimonas sp. S1H14]|uniref:glycosyltransferase n=1 Tax=Brevundimonas sp. S1H14 TaxID=3078084 RepID=UPI0039EB88B2